MTTRKRAFLGLIVALCVTSHASAGSSIALPTGCTIVGVTDTQDEGFPMAHCADGRWLYQDMDGIDGSKGTEGDGRWIDASGYVLLGR